MGFENAEEKASVHGNGFNQLIEQGLIATLHLPFPVIRSFYIDYFQEENLSLHLGGNRAIAQVRRPQQVFTHNLSVRLKFIIYLFVPVSASVLYRRQAKSPLCRRAQNRNIGFLLVFADCYLAYSRGYIADKIKTINKYR